MFIVTVMLIFWNRVKMNDVAVAGGRETEHNQGPSSTGVDVVGEPVCGAGSEVGDPPKKLLPQAQTPTGVYATCCHHWLTLRDDFWDSVLSCPTVCCSAGRAKNRLCQQLIRYFFGLFFVGYLTGFVVYQFFTKMVFRDGLVDHSAVLPPLPLAVEGSLALIDSDTDWAKANRRAYESACASGNTFRLLATPEDPSSVNVMSLLPAFQYFRLPVLFTISDFTQNFLSWMLFVMLLLPSVTPSLTLAIAVRVQKWVLNRSHVRAVGIETLRRIDEVEGTEGGREECRYKEQLQAEKDYNKIWDEEVMPKLAQSHDFWGAVAVVLGPQAKSG